MAASIRTPEERPAVTAIEGAKKSWLTLLAYAGTAAFLGRMAWRQVVDILGRGDGDYQFRGADLVVLLVIGLGLFLLVRLIYATQNFLNSLRLDQGGELAKARVIDKWRKRGSEVEDYWIAYEYGEQLRARARLMNRDFQRLEVGDDLMVEYLPGNPTVTRIRMDLPA
ncbi:MAG: hypothetical protein P1P76_02020 [Anaerolineales bacterium]|nr:hypothetical protein [Anaerolineales bacterium]